MGKYDDIEDREIRRDGMVKVKNSGRSSKTTAKGDAILDEEWLVDFKYTEKSFTLSRGVWSKVSSDAHTNGNRNPLLKVILEGDDNTTLRLWIMDDKQFQQIRNERAELEYLTVKYPELVAEAIEECEGGRGF